MTAKPPSASSLTPDTPTDTTATVTFTEIRDSKDILVGQNTITYDKTLTGKGTAASNTELWLRDRTNKFEEVTSGALGIWIKTFTLSDFKRYSLTAIEKNPPQDFSSPARTFLLATETPIINTVVGDEGPIQSGDTYHGDSVEITGNAPPSVEVIALDGEDELEKELVNADGVFELILNGLTAGTTYNIKIRAPDGKESATFVLIKPSDLELSLDDVLESESGPSVPEGDTTYKNKLIIRGHAKPGASVQLLNHDSPIEDATAPADPTDGAWTIPLDVTEGSYSLTAEALGEVTDPPRTFIVAVEVELSLDDVLESEAGPSVPEGDTTYKDKLIIQGHAKPGASVQLLNHDSPIDDATAPADPIDGAWEIPLDVTEGSYSLTAEVLGEKTAPPRTFTVASTERPQITHVTDSDGPIDDNGDTRYTFVVVRGDAAPSEGIRIKINGVIDPTIEPTDDRGQWARLRTGLVPGTEYQFIAVAAYDDNPESDSWTINVLPSGNATED
ncbi:carboxypeptidase regulatory-like domain-containing protein [Pseudomonas silesiensis]|uniref:carboxypeptidase regulatory-like domain-containing protein n=1 Tax=Pseudomonas silesiensis TaxID=1853130 RepID=UPI0030DBFB53